MGHGGAERERTCVDTLLQTLTGLDAWAVYVLLGVLVFGESAAVTALLLPGEIALLAAGVVVARGHAELPIVLAVAVVAAVAGHAAGYELGRRHGLRLLRLPLLRRHADAVDDVAALVTRQGAAAVFLGRWTNVSRVLVPLLVGTKRMRYRTFTLYNVAGGVVWVAVFVLLGTAAGASLDTVQRVTGHASSWLTGAVAIGAAIGWAWRRTRRRRTGNTTRRNVSKGGELRCTVPLAGWPQSGSHA